MATGIGLSSFLGLGEEGTYGTAVARDLFLYHNGESIKPSENRPESPALYRVSRHAARRVLGNVSLAGDFSFNPGHNYKAWTRILKHTLGAVSTSQPDVTTAPTAYRHTFTPADTLPTGLSIEIGKDVLAHLHSGCKITGLRMSGAAGELMDVSASVIGRETTSISPSGPSLTEGTLIVLTNTVISWNGVNQSVTDFNVSIDNGLVQRFFTNSRYSSEPLRNAKRRVSGSFTIELENATLYSDFRNATKRELIITCTGDTIAGAYAYETKITLPVSELTDAFAQADKEGPLMIPCSFESFINSGNSSEVTVRVTNEQSAAT